MQRAPLAWGSAMRHHQRAPMKPYSLTVTTLDVQQTLHMKVDASDWLAALRVALHELGLERTSDADVRCQIRADGAVEVTLIGLEDRRFVVVDDPSDPGATLDQLDALDPWQQSPSITVDEMAALPFVDQPATRPSRRHTKPAEERGLLYPAVSELSGDREASLRESLMMLAAHVPCERALLLIPNAARSAWKVALDSVHKESPFEGSELSCLSPLPGPVSRLIARRRFDKPVTLTFVPEGRAPHLFQVHSALWAIARKASDIQGVFMLLNARDGEGFSRENFEATRELSQLLSRRLQAR